MMRTISKLGSRPNVLARAATASVDRPPVTRGRALAGAASRPRQITPKRIGLFGLFGSGNSGNDGSLEAMLNFLRQVRPDTELVCFCACSPHAADQIAREFRLPTMPFAWPRPASALLRLLDRLSLKAPRQLASLTHAIGQARSLDVLIIPGTGILDDFQAGPSGLPLALFGWCLAARLCGTSIAFVSIGAGPIQHPVSRWLMRSAVAMAHYRSYRDTVSKAFMESIGFDTRNDPVYPDLAFRLPAPPSVRRTKDGPLSVGVGVMSYYGWRNDSTSGAAIYAVYLEKITRFALWLLDRGHRVRVLSGAEADWHAVVDLVTGVSAARPELPQHRLLAEPVSSLHDLMRQIAETDIVVATRFHNVVCALKLGKPTVSIGYAEKNDVLMAEMGVGRFCQHIEHLKLDLLIEQFTQLTSDRPSYERRIAASNRAYQKHLEQQESLVASRLL